MAKTATTATPGAQAPARRLPPLVGVRLEDGIDASITPLPALPIRAGMGALASQPGTLAGAVGAGLAPERGGLFSARLRAAGSGGGGPRRRPARAPGESD